MTDKTDNPIAKLGLKAYSGKLKGKQAVEISLKEQDAQFDSIKYESLTIIESGTGKKVARIPYNELSTFHVITGEGKRKAGVSFEHKPDPNKNGTNYFVYMDSKAAKDCADTLMKILEDVQETQEATANEDPEAAGGVKYGAA